MPCHCIDQSEVYPTNSWSDDDICAYFENRFKTGKQSDEGENVSICFWSALVKYTNWISAELNIGIKEICSDGKGYKNHYAELNDIIVSTEIVHCKSRGEEGVQECADASFNKWMEKIISLFKGKAIVLVGSIARRYAQEIKTFSHVQKNKISVLCISHPNAHGLSDDDRIEEIRKQI